MVGASLGLAISLVLQVEQAPVEVEETLRREEPVRFDLGARVELRSGQPEGTSTSNLTDLEVDPVAAVRIPFRSGSITLAYEPRLFIVAHLEPAQEGKKVSYLNRARVVLDADPSPRWRVYLNGRFAYGENDFLPLSTVTTPAVSTGQPPIPPGTTPTAPTPSPTPNAVPNTRFLRIVGLDGSAGFVYSLGPRLSWQLSGGYLYSGGADVEVRSSLPLQKGPRGTTALQWSASRADTLASQLDASNTRFSNGQQSTIASLGATWTHAWNRDIGTDLMGGAGATHSITPVEAGGLGGVHNAVYPVGGVGLRWNWLTRMVWWRNSITFLAAPAADMVTGAVTQRLSAGVHSALSPVPPLILEVTGSGSKVSPGSQRDVRVEGRATYQLGPLFGVSLGARAAWLEASTLLGNNGFGWLAFVSVGTSGGTNLFGAAQ